MTLTKQDLSNIKEALQPEFVKSEDRIRKALQPEFTKLDKKIDTVRDESQSHYAKLDKKIDNVYTKLNKKIDNVYTKLNKKIGTLKRENRKDHNMIIGAFDKADHKLANRISRVEPHHSPLSILN